MGVECVLCAGGNCGCSPSVEDDGLFKSCLEVDCPLMACVAPCKKCVSVGECTECIDYDNRNSEPDCSCLMGFESNLENKCVK